MKRIFICSRLRSYVDENGQYKSVEDNLWTLRHLCRAVIRAGHRPVAPHGYYIHFLDDSEEVERELGMRVGKEDLIDCAEVWVWPHDGISSGMEGEIGFARGIDKPLYSFVETDPMKVYDQGCVRVIEYKEATREERR